jgi:predicted alpha/beta-fold hydrolase
MPLITDSIFYGNRYLRGSHLDTITPALFRRQHIVYQRERITLPDGDFIDLDRIRNSNDRVLVLLHGLEGCSDSQYIKGMASYFSERGWDVCAVNFRSCSGEMNALLRSYHSGATEDLDHVFSYIADHDHYRLIVAGGFSLGGNMLLKYLGEQRYRLPSALQAAFAFSVPCDLAASAIEMARSSNAVYMQRFLKSLRKKMIAKAAAFPGMPDTSDITSVKTFHQFDNRFTAPIHGFNDAADYYDQCSSLRYIKNISIPVLLVNAQNDPFLTPTCFPTDIARNHDRFFFESPVYGGHVGFAEGLPNGKYWSEDRAFNFISSICN